MPTLTHTTDIVVETANAYQPETILIDWTEEAIDTTDDFDRVYSLLTHAPGSSSERGYIPYGTRAGFGVGLTAWDGKLSTETYDQTFDYWYGATRPWTPSVDGPEFVRKNIRDSILYKDSTGNFWTIVPWQTEMQTTNGTYCSIEKKTSAGTHFVKIEERQTALWATSRVQTLAFRAVQDGNDLHIVWLDQNDGSEKRIFYSLFDMGTETWTVEDEEVYSGNWYSGQRGIAIEVRTTGEVIVLHHGTTYDTGSRTTYRIAISRRTGTATWVMYEWIPSYTDFRTQDIDKDAWNSLTIGKDDRVHVTYTVYSYDDSAWRMHHRSLSNTNVFDTDVAVETSIAPNTSENEKAMATTTVVDGADVYCYMAYQNTDSTVIIIKEWKSEANPTFTTMTVTPTTTYTSRFQQYSFGRGWNLFTSAEGDIYLLQNKSGNVYYDSAWHFDGSGFYLYRQKTRTGDFIETPEASGRMVAWYSAEIIGVDTAHKDYAHRGNAQPWGNASSVPTHIIDGGTEYIVFPDEPSRSRATDFVVVEMPQSIVATKTHTTDAVLKATIETTHTTDAFLVAEGLTQITDHTTDMVIVARVSIAHTTDVLLADRITTDHTTDAYLVQIVEFDINVVTSFAVAATYTLERPPGIEAIRVRDVAAHDTGLGKTGGGSYHTQKKRRVDRG